MPSTIAFGFSNSVSIGASKFRRSHQNISPAAEPKLKDSFDIFVWLKINCKELNLKRIPCSFLNSKTLLHLLCHDGFFRESKFESENCCWLLRHKLLVVPLPTLTPSKLHLLGCTPSNVLEHVSWARWLALLGIQCPRYSQYFLRLLNSCSNFVHRNDNLQTKKINDKKKF